MPKIKSNSGAAKRFKKTGSGKFKRSQSHFTTTAKDCDARLIQRMLPYS